MSKRTASSPTRSEPRSSATSASPIPAEVAVSERHGTVTLRGSVGSLHQRKAQSGLLARRPAVLSVEDELSVDPRDRWQRQRDPRCGAAGADVERAVPADRIEVAVDNGWLTLKGEVRRQSETDAAFEAVRRLPGVGGITNEIKVITAGIDG